MFKKSAGALVYHPSDLFRYKESPFAAWLERYHLEFPEQMTPEKVSEAKKLIRVSGNKHEQHILADFRSDRRQLREIDIRGNAPETATRAAVLAGHDIIDRLNSRLVRESAETVSQLLFPRSCPPQ